MTGIYKIIAYERREYKKSIMGVIVDSKVPTTMFGRVDALEIIVEARNSEDAIVKAKLLIDRPFYDIVLIREKKTTAGYLSDEDRLN